MSIECGIQSFTNPMTDDCKDVCSRPSRSKAILHITKKVVSVEMVYDMSVQN